MSLGNNIKEQRQKNNLTQKDLADSLFVSSQAVSRWERDEVEPNITTLLKMCEIFHCTVEELTEGLNEKEEPMVEEEVIIDSSIKPRSPFISNEPYISTIQPFLENYTKMNNDYVFSGDHHKRIENRLNSYIDEKKYAKRIRLMKDGLVEFVYNSKEQYFALVYKECEQFVVPVETFHSIKINPISYLYKQHNIGGIELVIIINCEHYVMEAFTFKFYACSPASFERCMTSNQSFISFYDISSIQLNNAAKSISTFCEGIIEIKNQILSGKLVVSPLDYEERNKIALEKRELYSKYYQDYSTSKLCKVVSTSLSKDKISTTTRYVPSHSKDNGGGSSGGGFALGFFLGIIGLIIGLAGGKEKTKEGAVSGFLVQLALGLGIFFLVRCSL